jgi:peptidoglycan/xylan/chitin deacetylase (PgdA/CDA1 family)
LTPGGGAGQRAYARDGGRDGPRDPALVAQWTEQLPSKQTVAGSSPAEGARWPRRRFLALAGSGAVSLFAGLAVDRHRPAGAATLRRAVALTFDDGPDPAYTPDVLRILRRFRAKATFFVVGVNAMAHPGLIRDCLEAGHEIGNHTLDHPDLARLDRAEVAAQIRGGEDAIVASGAPRPHLFRPPKGRSDAIVHEFAEAEGYETFLWHVCLERFVRQLGIEQGVRELLEQVGPGTIILAHDGGRIEAPGHPTVHRAATVAALPLLLEGLRHRQYAAASITTVMRLPRI